MPVRGVVFVLVCAVIAGYFCKDDLSEWFNGLIIEDDEEEKENTKE